ncbi:hypothetical protein VTH82DRAFT_1037 [Thermothelomyces myriococcoides]
MAIDSERRRNEQLRQEMEKVKLERDAMSRSMQNQEERIRQVQTRVFKDIGSDSWATGDDGTSRTDLENLYFRLKNWTRKHAIQDMCETSNLAPEEYKMFLRQLSNVVQLGSGTPDPIEHLKGQHMNKKSPAMCMQGLLAQYVYSRIICQPFFVFGDGGVVLQEIFEYIQRVDQNESHMLRSRTLRLLATPPPGAREGECAHHNTYRAHQNEACRELAVAFYNSPAKNLIKPASRADGSAAAQCFNELQLIMQHAGDLSHKLWSRRTTLRALTLRNLGDTPFRKWSEYTKAHPLHRLYEDDDRCNDWIISAVTHPGVVAYGGGDGEDYSTPRVWMKAEVWLTENAVNRQPSELP